MGFIKSGKSQAQRDAENSASEKAYWAGKDADRKLSERMEKEEAGAAALRADAPPISTSRSAPRPGWYDEVAFSLQDGPVRGRYVDMVRDLRNLSENKGYTFTKEVRDVFDANKGKDKAGLDERIIEAARLWAANPGRGVTSESLMAQVHADYALDLFPPAEGGEAGANYIAEEISKALKSGVTKEQLGVQTKSDNQLIADMKDSSKIEVERFRKFTAKDYTDLSEQLKEQGLSDADITAQINRTKELGAMTDAQVTTFIQGLDVSAKLPEYKEFLKTSSAQNMSDLSTAAGENRTQDWADKKVKETNARMRIYGPAAMAVAITGAILGVPYALPVASAMGVAVAKEQLDAAKTGEPASWKPVLTAGLIAGGAAVIGDVLAPDTPMFDAAGNPMLDAQGNPIYQTQSAFGDLPIIGTGIGGIRTGIPNAAALAKAGYTPAQIAQITSQGGIGGLLPGGDKEGSLAQDLLAAGASIGSEKIVRAKEGRQLEDWYKQQLLNLEQEHTRAGEDIGRTDIRTGEDITTRESQTGEDITTRESRAGGALTTREQRLLSNREKARTALARSQHLQDLMARETLSQRGLSKEGSIGTSTWTELGTEQEVAREGLETGYGRQIEDIGTERTQLGEDVGRQRGRLSEDVGRQRGRLGEDVTRQQTRLGQDVTKAEIELEQRKELEEPSWENIIKKRAGPSVVAGAAQSLLGEVF